MSAADKQDGDAPDDKSQGDESPTSASRRIAVSRRIIVLASLTEVIQFVTAILDLVR